MTAFEFMAGDHDYRAAADLPAQVPTTVADFRQKLADLEAKHTETQAQLTAMEQRHEHLFTAVEALSKSPELTQFAQQLVAAVLVDHLKGWSKS